MVEERVEGIVLQAREYKENQRLVTLFTPLGVLSLIVKGLKSGQGRWLMLTQPFSHGEYHIKFKNSSLIPCYEATLWNAHLDLRQELASIETAGALAQAILYSQLPGKESFQLFALYKAYHSQVVRCAKSPAFLASFYLKLLKVEGLLGTHLISEVWEGEKISLTDRALLEHMIECSQFSLLAQTPCSEPLLQRVKTLFLESCGQ